MMGQTHQLFLSASDQMNVANDLPVIIRVTEGNDINNKHIAVQFSDLTCDKSGNNSWLCKIIGSGR
jgi:hypothetical protein